MVKRRLADKRGIREKEKMTSKKQERKLIKIARKAQECLTREEAQKLLRKARTIFKKLDDRGTPGK